MLDRDGVCGYVYVIVLAAMLGRLWGMWLVCSVRYSVRP